MAETQQPPEVSAVSDETLQVLRNRYDEARKAGMSIAESELFRDSDQDVGLLRKLVEGHATPEQLVRILL